MASLFPGYSCAVFFRLDIRDQVGAPQLQDLRQDLVNGKHLELFQPFIDGLRDRRVRMESHDVSHVLY